MLESIKGIIMEVGEDRITVDVNGFGLSVYTPFKNKSRIIGNEIFLYTYLSITQSQMVLYGFEKKEGRDLFKTIIKVPNVGPKTAFSLMSGLGTSGIKKALADNDPEPISKVKGIGSKTAKRIILELKDKLEFAPKKELKEAKKALIALGFQSWEADNSILKVLKDSGELTADEIVERVLKGL